MFSGIVEEVGTVARVEGDTITISAGRVLEDTREGSSIAVNGVCLTVTSLEGGAFSVRVVPETLRRTNLGSLRPGDRVNLERPLQFGGRVGGHLVQGHIDATARLAAVAPEGNSLLMRFEAPRHLRRYIVEKGFVALDGVSLTVAGVEPSGFTVAVIPYTRDNTVLGLRRPGDLVNLEVDILAKYLEQLLRLPPVEPLPDEL